MEGDEGIFGVDVSDKMQIVDSASQAKPIVYTMTIATDVYDTISYFLGMKSNDDPFYVVDLAEIQRKYTGFTKALPRVKPFYAIKSNPDPMILDVLAKLGCGFDCASKDEIIAAKSTGVSMEKLLYANPTKDISSLQFARSQDVDLLTFDSRCELDKIKVFHPDAKCIIRIKVDDSGSECKFSTKFGCSFEEAKELLELARINGIDVHGISFHVGSNCKVTGQYMSALRDARAVYDVAKQLGYSMQVIDIGGGFPGTDESNYLPGHNSSSDVTLEMMSKEINLAIDTHFSDIEEMTFIAEPGRAFCTSSHTLVVTIIGIKKFFNKQTGENEFKYTINEGIYGSFNCIVFDHAHPQILPFNERTEKTYKSSIFGCTCDSIDVVSQEIYLPKLAIGDRLFVQNFGAYTRASSSSFNGFKTHLIHYIVKT